MSSEKIRKFERLMFNGDPTVMNPAGRNINRSIKSIDDSKMKVIGTFTYDFEKGTETYTPAEKKDGKEG